jgi:hypothetical protein
VEEERHEEAVKNDVATEFHGQLWHYDEPVDDCSDGRFWESEA